MSKASLRTLFTNQALLQSGWAKNVRISWNKLGIIEQIKTDTTATKFEQKVNFLLPGMSNLHCHSFQRSMAGLAEQSNSANDSFWTWRDLMYRFSQYIGPKDAKILAAFTYMQMLQSGFTSVGEFHYLHHQGDGTNYDDPAEMAKRIIAAADQVGITITMLPVFYAHSDFAAKAAKPEQAPFVHKLDDYLQLIQNLTQQYPNIIIGIAPHSLRAVTGQQLTEILAANPTGPVHIHIAEQMAEVQRCIAHTGARPVQWLLDNYQVDERWCLIHATHLGGQEITQMARSGAIAGLCPITEANLGDGIFDGVSYAQADGKFGIGSDSCVRIDLADELRTYEYSQRLRDQARARLAPTGVSVAGHLYRKAAIGGAASLGQNCGQIALGKTASFVALDTTQPSMIARSEDKILDSWVFASQDSPVQDVWVAGEHVIKNKLHKNQQAITNAYNGCLSKLIKNADI